MFPNKFFNSPVEWNGKKKVVADFRLFLWFLPQAKKKKWEQKVNKNVWYKMKIEQIKSRKDGRKQDEMKNKQIKSENCVLV